MQHHIPVETLGPLGPIMAEPVTACVHCGFCLAACPTYRVLGEEMDSPRGRIFLMKDVLEGQLELDEAMPYIDRCLGCVACEPACPSGVAYGELLMAFREYASRRRRWDLNGRLRRVALNATLPYRERFRLAVTLGRVVRPLAGLLPSAFRPMLAMLPDTLPSAPPLPEVYPARGQRRARVALLVGCVQQVLAPEINRATLRVLAHNGVEVVVPRGQGCCGALSMHAGDADRARGLARSLLQVFPEDVDAVITNAAGCGSGMKEYGVLFKGRPEEEHAQAFARRVRDVHEFLADLGLVSSPALPTPMTVAYHDACHLLHAQGIHAAPRALLSQVKGLEVREVPEGELCCGSAGTYNLEQPEIAHQLGRRKVQNILTTGAEAVVTGNIGCMVQIAAHLRELGRPLPVYHTMQVLEMGYSHSGHES